MSTLLGVDVTKNISALLTELDRRDALPRLRDDKAKVHVIRTTANIAMLNNAS
jgi:hypothetical protein